jgi:hypothetical protein
LRLRIILLTLAANSPPWSACQGFWHKNSVTCDVCVCVCACVCVLDTTSVSFLRGVGGNIMSGTNDGQYTLVLKCS